MGEAKDTSVHDFVEKHREDDPASDTSTDEQSNAAEETSSEPEQQSEQETETNPAADTPDDDVSSLDDVRDRDETSDVEPVDPDELGEDAEKARQFLGDRAAALVEENK